MIWIGIDPGKKGAYAQICGDRVEVWPWDDAAFVEHMHTLVDDRADFLMAAVEKVGAMPGQGTVSMFSFGKSAGFIEGVLAGLGVPYQLIPPATWKREFSLIRTEKRQSIVVARRLFPNVDLRPTERARVESDGCADAVLLAEYARRKL